MTPSIVFLPVGLSLLLQLLSFLPPSFFSPLPWPLLTNQSEPVSLSCSAFYYWEQIYPPQFLILTEGKHKTAPTTTNRNR